MSEQNERESNEMQWNEWRAGCENDQKKSIEIRNDAKNESLPSVRSKWSRIDA